MAAKEQPFGKVLFTVITPLAVIAGLLFAGIDPLEAGVLIVTIGATGFILSTLEDKDIIDAEDKWFGLILGVGTALIADWAVKKWIITAQSPLDIALAAAIAGAVGTFVATVTSWLLSRLGKRIALSLRMAAASSWLE